MFYYLAFQPWLVSVADVEPALRLPHKQGFSNTIPHLFEKDSFDAKSTARGIGLCNFKF